MPSNTFLNLKEEKKEKLVDAAIKEFSSVLLDEVSINKIIANASISRGSFYTYFDNKYDLFYYILLSLKEKLYKIVKKEIILTNGNLRETFINLYDNLFERFKKIKSPILFKNIFLFYSVKKEHFKAPSHQLYEDIKGFIDKKQLQKVDLEFVFDVLMHNLFASCLDGLNTINSQEEKENYIRKLDIICYGIYKIEGDN